MRLRRLFLSFSDLFFSLPVIPKLLPFAFGEEPLNSGQVVTVPCAVVEGDPPLKLRWTLNGHAISPHSGISIVDLGGRGAILSIGSVQATHAGTYTCVAENLAGRHELSADLIVNGAYLISKDLLDFSLRKYLANLPIRAILIPPPSSVILDYRFSRRKHFIEIDFRSNNPSCSYRSPV